MKPMSIFLGAFALLAPSLALPTAGHALTSPQAFAWTSDHCSGTGGCSPSGSTTVTQSGSTLTFSTTLGDSLHFLGGNGAGIAASFAFDLNTSGFTGPLTFSNITSTSTFAAVSTSPTNIMMDGAGTFNFGLICTSCGAGGSNPDGQTLSFTIAATGLDINDLITVGGTTYFAADVISCSTTTSCTGTGTGNTGVIDATAVPGPLAGAGLPGLMAACSGLFFLARRRRQKVA